MFLLAKGKKTAKNGKTDYSANTILNFGSGSYLESTSRPFYALIFLLPLIVIYEMGTILVNTNHIFHTQSRVAAFTWLMGLAEWIGMHRSLAWAFPGFVVLIILLCWHLSSKYPWRIRLKWLAGMYLECIALCLPLFAFGAVLNRTYNFAVTTAASSTVALSTNGSSSYLAKIVTSIGAGIYEELVFRLILIGLIIVLMEDLLHIKDPTATIVAVLVSAALFAAHHYVGIENGRICRLAEEPFTLGSFLFRTLAGIYFAIIFRYRGYGITAGTHAAYNVILFTIKSLFET
jgi:hypothetical protein